MSELNEAYNPYNPFFRNNYNRFYMNNYRNQQRKNAYEYNKQKMKEKQRIENEKNSTAQERKAPSGTKKSNGFITFNPNCLSDCNEFALEIIGIKLHLDDLIILGLLFFLYTEEVKDELLFIALILLLLG